MKEEEAGEEEKKGRKIKERKERREKEEEYILNLFLSKGEPDYTKLAKHNSFLSKSHIS